MTPQERILSLSIPEPNTGCWLWIGATKGKSQLKQYGHLIIGSRTDGTRKTTSAHLILDLDDENEVLKRRIKELEQKK